MNYGYGYRQGDGLDGLTGWMDGWMGFSGP